jgi:hypothetical protein
VLLTLLMLVPPQPITDPATNGTNKQVKMARSLDFASLRRLPLLATQVDDRGFAVIADMNESSVLMSQSSSKFQNVFIPRHPSKELCRIQAASRAPRSTGRTNSVTIRSCILCGIQEHSLVTQVNTD